MNHQKIKVSQSEAGFGLVQVLVSAGLTLMILGFVAQSLVSQLRQTNYIQSKMASIELQRMLGLIMINSDGKSCGCMFGGTNNITLPTSGEVTMPFVVEGFNGMANTCQTSRMLEAGKSVNSSSNALKIQKLALSNRQNTVPGYAMADFNIHFEQAQGQMQLPPIATKIIAQINAAGVIQSCRAVAADAKQTCESFGGSYNDALARCELVVANSNDDDGSGGRGNGGGGTTPSSGSCSSLKCACYNSLSGNSNLTFTCGKPADSSEKMSCYKNLSGNSNLTTVCGKPENSAEKMSCYRNTNGNSNLTDICGVPTNSTEKMSCYNSFSGNSNLTFTCGKPESSAERMSCYNNLSGNSNLTNICGKPEGPVEVANCYRNVSGNSNLVNICGLPI